MRRHDCSAFLLVTAALGARAESMTNTCFDEAEVPWARASHQLFLGATLPPPPSLCTDACVFVSEDDCDDDDSAPGFEFPMCAYCTSCVDCCPRVPRAPPPPPAGTPFGTGSPICAYDNDCVHCDGRTASPPRPPHSPGMVCTNNCHNAGGSSCSDGGCPGSEFATCAYYTNSVDCGPRVSMPSPPPRPSRPPAAHPAPNPPPSICSDPCFTSHADDDDGGPGFECLFCASRAVVSIEHAVMGTKSAVTDTTYDATGMIQAVMGTIRAVMGNVRAVVSDSRAFVSTNRVVSGILRAVASTIASTSSSGFGTLYLTETYAVMGNVAVKSIPRTIVSATRAVMGTNPAVVGTNRAVVGTNRAVASTSHAVGSASPVMTTYRAEHTPRHHEHRPRRREHFTSPGPSMPPPKTPPCRSDSDLTMAPDLAHVLDVVRAVHVQPWQVLVQPWKLGASLDDREGVEVDANRLGVLLTLDAACAAQDARCGGERSKEGLLVLCFGVLDKGCPVDLTKPHAARAPDPGLGPQGVHGALTLLAWCTMLPCTESSDVPGLNRGLQLEVPSHRRELQTTVSTSAGLTSALGNLLVSRIVLASGTYNLIAELSITRSVILEAAVAGSVILNAQASSTSRRRVVNIDPGWSGVVQLIRLNITGGSLDGGGVYVASGTVTLSSCTISGNTANSVSPHVQKFPSPRWETHVLLVGGGVAVWGGTVSIVNSQIYSNTASTILLDMCVLMCKTSHCPDGKMADVLAPTHVCTTANASVDYRRFADALALTLAWQLWPTLLSTTVCTCHRDLKISHRPDGNFADDVRAAKTFKSSHSPNGKMADTLALTLACTTAADPPVDYSGDLEVSHRPDGEMADALALILACATATDASINYRGDLESSHRPDAIFTHISSLCLQGGGVYVNTVNSGTVTISSCTISGNIARNGGGVFINSNYYYSTVTLSTCTITGNAVYTSVRAHTQNLPSPPWETHVALCLQGGGVFVLSGRVIISSCTISENSAGYGPNVYVSSGSVCSWATTLASVYGSVSTCPAPPPAPPPPSPPPSDPTGVIVGVIIGVIVGVIIALVILHRRRRDMRRNKVPAPSIAPAKLRSASGTSYSHSSTTSSSTMVGSLTLSEGASASAKARMTRAQELLKAWELDASEITTFEKLGEGGQAVVVRGWWHGIDVAVKEPRPLKESHKKPISPDAFGPTSPNDSFNQALRREVRALSRVRHPNVIKLHGACFEPVPMILMSYAPSGTLQDALDKHKFQTPSAIVRLLAGIARGMEAVHAHKIIHLDLKPENVLIGPL
eukprot:jgi/Chrpa1/16051/Chrysochromulina_OHIO_Genome00018894-RA